MTTDDATADDLEAGSEPNSDSNSNSDSDSSTDSPEPASELSLERTAIVICLGGTIVGSTLPWVLLEDVTIYGFETAGLATIAIATATGAIDYSLDWNRWAMIATFVAGVLIASIALVYVPLGGIGAFVTLVFGAVLAFVGLIGYDKQG